MPFIFLHLFYIGSGKIQQIQLQSQNPIPTAYTGILPVIEDGCSLKPKIFSHFSKEKMVKNNGDLTTLHYAMFKVSSFPSMNSKGVSIILKKSTIYRLLGFLLRIKSS